MTQPDERRIIEAARTSFYRCELLPRDLFEAVSEYEAGVATRQERAAVLAAIDAADEDD